MNSKMPATALQERATTKAARMIRDAAFAKDVLRHAAGRCCACPDGVDYGSIRILQAAHVRSVEASGRDHLTNGLPMCPNHHALFDRFFWAIDVDQKIVAAPDLPQAVRRSLRRRLACRWTLDERQRRWHWDQFQRVHGKRRAR
jgi:predicted restriction endonuclease